jgi:hypothetical protein
MPYFFGSLLESNPNSLFKKAKKGNPGGIPRNPWGMHNLASQHDKGDISK